MRAGSWSRLSLLLGSSGMISSPQTLLLDRSDSRKIQKSDLCQLVLHSPAPPLPSDAARAREEGRKGEPGMEGQR